MLFLYRVEQSEDAAWRRLLLDFFAAIRAMKCSRE